MANSTSLWQSVEGPIPGNTLRSRCLRNSCLVVAAAFVLGAQTTRSVWDGVYSQDQAGRGKALYTKECAGCHGTELTGGEEAPPLTGGAFTANWNGLSVG